MIKYILYLLIACILCTGCYAKRGYKHYRAHYTISKSKDIRPDSLVSIVGNIYYLDKQPAHSAYYGAVETGLNNLSKEGEISIKVTPGIYTFMFHHIVLELNTRKINIKAGYKYIFSVYLGGGKWVCS